MNKEKQTARSIHTHTHTHTHVLEIEKEEWDPHGQNIMSMENEDKDLGLIIQDNLFPEKQIAKIFGETFIMLRNIRIAFHFLDKDMIKILFNFDD